MLFEWDEAKNQENIRKHRIDFDDVSEMFDSDMLVELDDRFAYGEERWIGTGFLRQGIAVVVWTERRGNVIRIISARKATPHEQQRFKNYLRDGLGSP
jgi:uncharacterized protein